MGRADDQLMDLFLQGIALGAIAGFLAGMFGIGGSTLLTPVLRTVLGMAPLVALATPLPVVIPTALSATLAYGRQGLVDLRTAGITGLVGIPATIVGAYATVLVSGQFLMLATALAIGLIGLDMGFGFSSRGGPRPGEAQPAEANAWVVAGIAAVAGFLAGFLAVGGGFILVPAYFLVLHFDIKPAIATSMAAIILLAIPGSIVHILLGHIDLVLTLGLAIGSIPLAYLGARVAIRMRSDLLKKLFAGALVVFAAYFSYSQL